MTATALTRESVARVGALVRVTSAADRAHTGRGRVESLSPYAPVAMVMFNCGCRSYVPLRRLTIDLGPPIPACEVSGCPNPRWEGPYCASHPRGAKSGESFEPKAQGREAPPSPSARNGSAIDDPGTKTVAARPPSPPRRPRATGTAAAADGGGRSLAVPPAPARPDIPVHKGGGYRWTPELIIAALRTWHEEHGRPPGWRDWRRADRSHPTWKTARARFGSWTAALAAAGFTPNPSGRRKRAE